MFGLILVFLLIIIMIIATDDAVIDTFDKVRTERTLDGIAIIK
jgi:hypothetical protein